MPIGEGKLLLGNPQGFGGRTLDAVVGGWQVGGTTIWETGTPLTLYNVSNVNIDNNVGIQVLYGNYATSNTDLANSAYKGDNAALLSPTASPSSATPRLSPTAVTLAQNFTYGNLPPVDGNIRNPNFTQTDLSAMKKFDLFGEGRYLQFRAEAFNAFNIRGFGPYNTQVGSPTYGLITSPGNIERRMQLSLRLVF